MNRAEQQLEKNVSNHGQRQQHRAGACGEANRRSIAAQHLTVTGQKVCDAGNHDQKQKAGLADGTPDVSLKAGEAAPAGRRLSGSRAKMLFDMFNYSKGQMN